VIPRILLPSVIEIAGAEARDKLNSLPSKERQRKPTKRETAEMWEVRSQRLAEIPQVLFVDASSATSRRNNAKFTLHSLPAGDVEKKRWIEAGRANLFPEKADVLQLWKLFHPPGTTIGIHRFVQQTWQRTHCTSIPRHCLKQIVSNNSEHEYRCKTCETPRLSTTALCPRCDSAMASGSKETMPADLMALNSEDTLPAPTLSPAQLLPPLAPLNSPPNSAGNTQARSIDAQVDPPALEQNRMEQSGQGQGCDTDAVSMGATWDVAASPSTPPTRAPRRRRMDVPCVVGVQSSPARKLLRQLELPGDRFTPWTVPCMMLLLLLYTVSFLKVGQKDILGVTATFVKKKNSYSGTTPYSLRASASLHMEEYTCSS
jgi:hypothetical protein